MGEHTPPPEGYTTWNEYWTKAHHQPWRTDPEVDEGRQQFLTEHRRVEPNVERGIYPFKDIGLTRADVEWLLATHEDGRGSVLSGEFGRTGLDLRGATLSGVNLSKLPLAGILGGLDKSLWPDDVGDSLEPIPMVEDAAAHLEGANLLEAQFRWAMLDGAHLEGANLRRANLYGADVRAAHLEEASLFLSHLDDANLFQAHLEGADLRFAFLGRGTYINDAHLTDVTNKKHGTAFVADIRWGEVNLSLVKWANVRRLGDEKYARNQQSPRWPEGKQVPGEPSDRRLSLFSQAVRANRQLATVLRAQGLNEEADRFAYRAQLCQRVVLRRQHKYLRYLGSWLLNIVAGYGYRPLRSLLTYFTVNAIFATAYFLIAHFITAPSGGASLTPLEAFIFSATSFHGRGFSPGPGGEHVALSNPLVMLSALEAGIGLLLEITFFATVTQRFLAR
jgi:uncharacterized protein YjbI with pentapeptide repeats